MEGQGSTRGGKMNFLTGFRSNVETISLLSRPHAEEGPLDFSSLKSAYQDYTSSIQPRLPQSRLDDIDFNNDVRDLKRYAAAFNEKSTLRDIQFSLQMGTLKDAPAKLRTVKDGYHKIQTRYPELGLLLRLTFNTVFSLPSAEAGGGSASSAIGVLWANPRGTWTENDVIEFLVHELTHNLVFLDERRHTHYVDLTKAVRQENWALSAVLGRLRPIDKSFHSLVVATEILYFRESFSGHNQEQYRVHPPSAVLQEKALRSANSLLSLKNREGLYAPRLLELTKRCKERLENLSLPQPAEALS